MRVRSIPPITSTGKNRRKSQAPLNGLAHISLGRYMSERMKSQREEEIDSWSVTKHVKSEFNRKSKTKSTTPFISDFVRKMECSIELNRNFNEEGDLAILLHFTGIEFLNDRITTYSNESRQLCYLIPVCYLNKENESYLMLTTVGDIFEYEVVMDVNHCCIGDCFMGTTKKKSLKTGEKEFCLNRLFREEAYIPELLQTYDSLSMKAVVKGSCIVVTYKKVVSW